MAEDTKPAAEAPAPEVDQVAELTKKLKTETDKHAFQKRRADGLQKSLDEQQATIDTLRRDLAAKEATAVRPPASAVVLDGEIHPIIGMFRADNTFNEVKRGNCPEGVTLVAIDKTH